MIASPQLRKDLRLSFIDGLAYSVMVGFGESFLAAFVLATGHSQLSAVMISTIPLFFGAILQLFTPWGMGKLKSYRRWLLLMAFLQACSLLVLAVLANFSVSLFVIMAIVTLYWAFALGAGPAWNAWLNQLIPTTLRTHFFSQRARWCHATTFIGLFLGGLVLHYFRSLDQPILGFSLIFIIAASGRFLSYWSLASQTPPRSFQAVDLPLKWDDLKKLFPESQLSRLLFFFISFQFATNVASGLFTPFMLIQLKLSYLEYMALLSSALLTRFFTLNYAKPLVTRFGVRAIFMVAVFCIVPLPSLWIWQQDLPYLFVFQALSGFGWGFFELITFLTLFNDLPLKGRTTLLTVFNFLQSTALFVGAILGGFLLYKFSQTWQAYTLVFWVSTALRASSLMLLPGIPWHLLKIKNWIEIRPISVRAHGGLLGRPVLVRLPLPRRRKKLNLENPLPSKPKNP